MHLKIAAKSVMQSFDGDCERLLNPIEQIGMGDLSLSSPSHCEFIEKPIYEGDSLQSISIKYRVPISELKRLNALTSDLSFFALKTIKIPAIPFGPIWNSVQSELYEQPRPTISTEQIDRIQFVLNKADQVLAASPEFSRNSLPRSPRIERENGGDRSGFFGLKSIHLACIIFAITIIAPGFYIYCYMSQKPLPIGW